MRRVGRSDVGPISTNHIYDQSRNVTQALGCGYTLSPGSRVIRGPRAARRRRSDYKPVLLQCGIITQDEFDALRGIELLGFGDAREQATVKCKDRSFSCGQDEPKLSSFLRRFVENVAPARDQSRDQIQLNDLAFELGVAPRRLYNIVTVLESLGIVEQGAEKGTFRWKGTDHMRGIPDYTMLNEDCFSESEWSVASNGNCENGMSIWSLSRKYVTLLQSKQVVHTTEAAEKLCELSGRCRHGAAKALEIQITEIAGLLVELGLARKIGSNTRARSSAYKWAGFEPPRRIVRVNGTRRNGSRGGSDRATKETTDHVDRSNPAPQDNNRRDIGYRDSVRLAGHSGTESSCPPPNYSFQPHPSSSSAPSPFTHFPMPLTVLSNASVVQLNQPSAMSMSHQAADQPGQVRSLTSPYGDQYFGILPLGGHDGLDGKGMNGMSRIDPALSITNSSKSGLAPGRQASANATTPSMFTPMVAYAVSNGRGLTPDDSSKPSSATHRQGADLVGHSRGRVNGDTPSVAHRKEFDSSMPMGQSLSRGLGRMEGTHRGQVGERQHHNPVWHVPKSRGNRGDSSGFIPPNSLIHTMATVSDREDGTMRSNRHEIRGGGGVGGLERWPGESTRNKVLKKDISSLMNLLARGAVANGAQDGYRTTQANSSPREMTNGGSNIRQLQ